MDGSILTNERFKEQVEPFKKESTPKQRKSKKKQIVSDTDEEISVHDESDDDQDLEDSDKGIAEDKGEKQQVTISNSDIGKYFAVYWNNPQPYYWGKLEKLFRDDVDQQAEKAEFKFLHKKSGIDGEICWD